MIIPTYNRSALLGNTLESLTGQSIGNERMEVLVVDDGSSDDTRATVARYADSLDLTYYFQEDKGNRTGRARNVGIGLAKNEVCVFIDSGIILGSACIESHVRSHAASADSVALIGYAYGFEQYSELDDLLVEQVDRGNPDASIAFFRTSGRFADLREACYRRYGDQLEGLPAPWVFFWTCNVSVKRDVLLAHGLFDENFDQTWGFEDIELAYRMHQSGVKIRLSRDAAVIHYPHGKEDPDYKEWCQHRNKYYFHEKHNSTQTKLYLESSCLDFNDFLLSRALNPVYSA